MVAPLESILNFAKCSIRKIEGPAGGPYVYSSYPSTMALKWENTV
jgi:hypothetical protein